jgi:hypothetical protein
VLRASCLVGEHSTTELYSQNSAFCFINNTLY